MNSSKALSGSLICLTNFLFGLPTRDTDQLETIFLTSSRYEYLFWEMSWNRTAWPV